MILMVKSVSNNIIAIFRHITSMLTCTFEYFSDSHCSSAAVLHLSEGVGMAEVDHVVAAIAPDPLRHVCN